MESTSHKFFARIIEAPIEPRRFVKPSLSIRAHVRELDMAKGRRSSVEDQADELSDVDDSPTRALYDVEHERDPDSYALPFLLSILNGKKPGSSISSLVNTTTIDLMCRLLSSEDYASFAAQVYSVSAAKNLLDFILLLFDNPRSMNLNGTMDIKRRGRRFMLKIMAMTPVIPESMMVTGIRTAEDDHIGRGGFGHVFKGELRGSAVALKVLYKPENDVAFCREALTWRSLRHRFILPFLGIYQDDKMGQFFLVSPYMKNGTLAQWRKKANPSIAEVEQRILEVAKGIQYIHSEDVVHGDLCGANVLLDANLHVQIADFGLTRLSEATNTRSGALRVNFAAPELLGFCEDDDSDEDNDFPRRTQRSDVYAFGCLYYEIHYDSVPFEGKTDVQVMRLHSRKAQPPRLDSPPLSDEAWQLIRSCWAREASERPGIADVTRQMIRRNNETKSICPICSRGLSTKHNVKNHMKSHYNVKDWICNDCGKGFTTNHVLKRHLKVCKKRKGRSGETDETNQPNPTEQYPSYETPPRAPWSALRTSNEKDLPALLKERLQQIEKSIGLLSVRKPVIM